MPSLVGSEMCIRDSVYSCCSIDRITGYTRSRSGIKLFSCRITSKELIEDSVVLSSKRLRFLKAAIAIFIYLKKYKLSMSFLEIFVVIIHKKKPSGEISFEISRSSGCSLYLSRISLIQHICSTTENYGVREIHMRGLQKLVLLPHVA
eukprot:TRINITY_DN2990_c0_g1_i2.p1 TRINITY_DN2990_c0_g1~~TRINITY_DN2990_c0_g1_i2.p1  ORF type:complete len:148 (-),score=19.35 TRINITY_DN2990_c0_g1_i2:443-886(-)